MAGVLAAGADPPLSRFHVRLADVGGGRTRTYIGSGRGHSSGLRACARLCSPRRPAGRVAEYHIDVGPLSIRAAGVIFPPPGRAVSNS